MKNVQRDFRDGLLSTTMFGRRLRCVFVIHRWCIANIRIEYERNVPFVSDAVRLIKYRTEWKITKWRNDCRALDVDRMRCWCSQWLGGNAAQVRFGSVWVVWCKKQKQRTILHIIMVKVRFIAFRGARFRTRSVCQCLSVSVCVCVCSGPKREMRKCDLKFFLLHFFVLPCTSFALARQGRGTIERMMGALLHCLVSSLIWRSLWKNLSVGR